MKKSGVLFLVVIMVASACSATKANQPDAIDVKESHHGEVHWSYSGETSPAHWAELSEDFQTCATGQLQSPVDVSDAMAKTENGIELNYSKTGTSVINNGHTLQVALTDEAQTMTVEGESFRLLQFHFHTPSENALNGKRFPMEAHFVHQDGKGNLAVLAVFMEEGEANASLQRIWDLAPATKSTSAAATEFNPKLLLPGDLEYFTFSGSLTTPPCSEGVHWRVLKTPIQVSKAQIEFFQSLYPINARPLQSRD